MRAVFGGSIAGTTRVDGQVLQQPRASAENQQNQREIAGRNARRVTRINGNRIHFRDLALFAWPHKADAHLAFHLKVDPRTARRWLSGNNEPPADALGVILAEIMKRFHQRD